LTWARATASGLNAVPSSTQYWIVQSRACSGFSEADDLTSMSFGPPAARSSTSARMRRLSRSKVASKIGAVEGCARNFLVLASAPRSPPSY